MRVSHETALSTVSETDVVPDVRLRATPPQSAERSYGLIKAYGAL